MSAGKPVGTVALIGGVAFATDHGTRLTAGAGIGGLAREFHVVFDAGARIASVLIEIRPITLPDAPSAGDWRPD
jgi:hypothetical protein